MDIDFSNVMRNEKDAIEALKAAKKWYEKNDPGSPILYMINKTLSLVGKNFLETV